MRTWALTLLALAVGLCAPGGAQEAVGLPKELAAETDLAQLPAGRYVPVQQWAAEDLAHGHGRLEDDVAAAGGKAWALLPDRDDSGIAVYGPYVELPPGNYLAFYRLKLLEAAEDETVAGLDACVAYASDMRGAREVFAEELPVGTYRQVPLGFRYEGGKLECRLDWPGAVGLHLDSVTLLRLEGGNLSQGAWRAEPAVPSGQPRDLTVPAEARPFPDILPRSAAPADELLVCDLRQSRSDVRLAIYCLQGLVNRTQPRLYCLCADSDELWLAQMRERGWVKSTRAVPAEQLPVLLREAYRGAIVIDPKLPASRNVATMLAGVQEGLPVSPRLNREWQLPVLADLRGKWQTSAAAYRWAFDTLWPQLNHHVTACSWPDHLALRDYLVQHKVFIFWLSGPLDGARKYASPSAEVRLMEELLAKMPVNTPVLSYPWAGKDVGIGEGPGVSLFAEFGHYLVGSIECGNLSVHSGLPVPTPKQRPAPAPPALQPDKVYLSLVLSDGDNLPVLTNHNFPQLWQDKLRGQFPLGWTLSPAALNVIPDLVDYYYRTATPNDQFLAAVSGVGYTYPDLYAKRYRDRAQVFDGFLSQTAEYMARSDLRDLWVMNATRPEIISRFAEKIELLDALFPDYGKVVNEPGEATFATARNVPVFRAATSWSERETREQRLARLVQDVRAMTPAQKPAFLHFFILNWFSDLPLLQEVLRQLGPGYVAVRPDHLAQLWRQEMARQQVLLRLPAAVAAIEGQPLSVVGSLRNMLTVPQQVAVRLPSGLSAGRVTPAQLALAPGQEGTFTVTGRAAGEALAVEVSGGFGTRREQVAVRQILRRELLGSLPAGKSLAAVAVLEAETLAHQEGMVLADRSAGGGRAWLATRGTTAPGHVVYGPYSQLAAGEYLALFRLQRTGGGSGVLAQLDTCVGGGTPQTGKRELRVEELPAGQWCVVPVPFSHPGGHYETRVQWSGAASLAVDAVSLWRVSGS